MVERLSTNPLDWIFAPIQSVLFKVLGFFWATMWGITAVNEFPFLDELLLQFLLGHIWGFLLWPMCIANPLTLPMVFGAGYILWALVYDVHPPLLLFMILSLMSAWSSFILTFDDFGSGLGWHSIPMLGIPLFIVGRVLLAKVYQWRFG